MNFSTFIVKLIEKPVQNSFPNNIHITEVLAIASTKFNSNKKPSIIKLVAWGSLSNILMNYYQKDDLLVIEGIVSLRPNVGETKVFTKSVEITLTSFYPYE